jgi:hypothetical protein
MFFLRRMISWKEYQIYSASDELNKQNDFLLSLAINTAMSCYHLLHMVCLLQLFITSSKCNNIEIEALRLEEDGIECKGGKLLSSSVCAPKFYGKADIPNTPTVINTSLALKNIRATNDNDKTITADIIFSLYWIDNRIRTKFSRKEKEQGRTVLEIQHLENIWQPDLYIYNLNEFNSHVVKGPLGGLSVLSNLYWENFNPNKTLKDVWIEYWFEAKVSIYCNFYYKQYPMDIQHCEFRMGSSNFGKNMIFKLMEGVVRFPTQGEDALHDFDMNITFFDTSGKYWP